MNKNENIENLKEMDTQYYLFWGDERFLDRPEMKKYKKEIKK